ncbi:MAG: transglycosylase domain-containing protein [Prevotella sp.]|nr:transglycosylase domain-containing protein [Prevotella sp.]
MAEELRRAAQWCGRALRRAWVWYRGLYVGKRWWVKTLAVAGSLAVLFFLYLGAVDMNFLWLFGKSPGFRQIENAEISQASEIYSADGVLIGKFFNENRTPVEYDDVNPIFWKCLIDTEDERYYSHHGIDFIGLFSAAKDAATGHGGRGASTITQQLAKNLFRVRTQYSTGLLGNIPGISILIMKTKEWIIATKLEYLYDKQRILQMYANTVDFGSNSFGIKTACRTYFKTTPAKLTAEQSAVLVGMLKATTYYNPKINPNNSLRRRNIVLDNMYAKGDLRKAECDSLKRLPIRLSYAVENNYDGQAQYFREAVADELKGWCEENGYDLYSSGLKIYTTLDTRMQRYAEEAAAKQMKQVQRNFDNHWGNNEPWVDERGRVMPDFIDGIVRRQPVWRYLNAKYPDEPDSVDYYLNLPHAVKVFTWGNDSLETTKILSVVDSVKYMVRFMHCSFVAMEPQTGYVRAYVGDVSFKSWKYDKVRAMRQPGSTFKLFVYTEAMNQGFTPCTERADRYISMNVWDAAQKKEVLWAPTNADGIFTGDTMPLKSAFARSVNSIAVGIGQEVGIKRIAETAHRMGIKSRLDDSAPSLALGSSDVSLLELANAYCTVADNGHRHDPVLVLRIEDSKGKEVYTAPQTDVTAISYKSAFLMQQMLQAGMREPGGTSMNMWGYVRNASDTDFGGKTGTSNNHSDAWFMCVSPRLVCGAWVGGEYRCIHFRTGQLGQGSRTALPICGYFIDSVMSDPAFKQYHARFDTPKDEEIEAWMYSCPGYYPHVPDTLFLDSLGVDIDALAPKDSAGKAILDPRGQGIAPSRADDILNRDMRIDKDE